MNRNGTTVISASTNKGFLYEFRKNLPLFIMLLPGVVLLIINN
ncbi:MAG: sugar ABC transporter permease, partial [Clostridiaceae bacterium]|nr:sugar ABC transporter permease [Clostridiaceae bacterium]